jgi:hypothetical protein
MNKKIIVSMGLPMEIRNKTGITATIELNKNDFVVCRYHPDNSVYLQDAKLINWHPCNWFRRVFYLIKIRSFPKVPVWLS